VGSSSGEAVLQTTIPSYFALFISFVLVLLLVEVGLLYLHVDPSMKRHICLSAADASVCMCLFAVCRDRPLYLRLQASSQEAIDSKSPLLTVLCL